VDNTTAYQNFVPGNPTYTATNDAVVSTSVYLYTDNGNIPELSYNSGFEGEACGGETISGSMSQWGTQTCAQDGDSWQQILQIYYGFRLTCAPGRLMVSAVDTGINNATHTTVSVFSVASDGDVYQTYLTGGSGKGWQSYNMTAAGVAPVAQAIGAATIDTGADNATHPTLSVFILGANGDVYQTFLTAGSGKGWQEYNLTGAGKAPVAQQIGAATVDTGADNATHPTVSVFIVGTNNDVYQTFLTGGGGKGWQEYNMTAAGVAPVAGSIGAATVDTGVNNATHPTVSVFSVATNADVYQTYLTGGSGKGWQEYNMTKAGVAPPASQVGAATIDTGADNATHPTLSVFSVGTNADVYQTFLTAGSGKGWQEYNLTGAGKAPPAYQVGAATVDTGVNNPAHPTVSVFSVATSNDVYQTYLTGGSGKGWQDYDMTTAGVAPPASQAATASLDTGADNPTEPTLSLYTASTGGDVNQTFLTAGSGKGWQDYDMTTAGLAPTVP
jgi:hypothetical protein